MLNVLKTSFIISVLGFALPAYADTDLDHGSELKAEAIRDAEMKSDTALEETIDNSRTSAKQTMTDLDHGSELKAKDIRDAEKKSDTALEETIENTSSTTY